MNDIKIYAEVIEPEAMEQFYEAMALPCNIQGALMPDTHSGYTLPIGAVVKSKGRVFPSYVGYDIGCGMCAVRLDVKNSELSKDDLTKIKEAVVSSIPLGPNKHKSKVTVPKAITDMDMTDFAKEIIASTGVYQLGTLGGGNHFIEVGTDSEDYLNIVIHSGSRGVGYKIADHYMKEACVADVDEERYIKEFDSNPKNIGWWKSIGKGKKDLIEKKEEDYFKARSEFVYRRTRARVNTNTEGHFSFDIKSERGKDYIKDMNMALDFALENRKTMIDEITYHISEVIGRNIKGDRFINRNHNHAVYHEEPCEVSLENPYGYIPTMIHRKGATHAEEGMMGVIPGNMKDGSFIVKGKGNQDSMCSSSHGAGRVLSRRKAKDQLDLGEFHKEMEGIVTNLILLLMKLLKLIKTSMK